jgi:RNA polymerase sigma factor (sigma-70 family)
MRPLISTALLRAQSDERLAALAKDGHEQAFVTIVERYRPALIRAARGVVGDARAEDVVQQATLKAWVAMSRPLEVTNLKGWLYSIVRNASYDALSRSGQFSEQLTEALIGAEAPDVVVERRLDARDALAALAALPEQQRDALMLTGIEGRSGDEAASRLGVTSGAVRQLVYRARDTLRSGATAITPLPLVLWALGKGGSATAAGATGAGTAGAAATGTGIGAGGAAVKVCATVAIAGALAGGATQVIRDDGQPARDREPAAAAEGRSTFTAGAPPARPAGAAAADSARRRDRLEKRRRELTRRSAADGSGDAGQSGQSGDQGTAGQRGASGSHGDSGDHGSSGDQPGAGTQGAAGAQGSSESTASTEPADADAPVRATPSTPGGNGAQGASGQHD